MQQNTRNRREADRMGRDLASSLFWYILFYLFEFNRLCLSSKLKSLFVLEKESQTHTCETVTIKTWEKDRAETKYKIEFS